MYSGMAMSPRSPTPRSTLWPSSASGKTSLGASSTSPAVSACAIRRGLWHHYALPNDIAYAETCTAIANAMWNHRMFLLHGDAKYIDVLERISTTASSPASRLAATTSSMSPAGVGWQIRLQHRRSGSSTLVQCSCCPSNVVRFLPSLPGYAYADTESDIYVNLFLGGQVSIPLPAGDVQLTQTGDYPVAGAHRHQVEPAQAQESSLRVRIPGWARISRFPAASTTTSTTRPRSRR